MKPVVGIGLHGALMACGLALGLELGVEGPQGRTTWSYWAGGPTLLDGSLRGTNVGA